MSFRTHMSEIPTKQDWIAPFVAVVLAVLGALVTTYAGYTSNDKTLSTRITVVETNQQQDHARLERIESKLDRVLEAVREPR